MDSLNKTSDKAEVANINNDFIFINSEKSNSSNKFTLQRAKKIKKKTNLAIYLNFKVY